MRRLIVFLVVIVCMFSDFTGSVLAGSAPSAMSYFKNKDYNKTYTADDGLQHTMSVKWVGETWNKVGTAIYSINYEDVYQKDENTYIDVKSATEIFENARPKYPDSPKHTVYQVKWYPDGHSDVIYDYRPAETPTPEAKPTPAPTSKPTAPASTKSPTAKSTKKPTAKPAMTATVAPTDNISTVPTATPIPVLIETVTPSPSPSPSATVSPSPAVTVAPASAEPEATDLTAQSGSVQNAPGVKWGWVIVVVFGICAAILIIRSLKNRKGSTKR